MLAPGSPGLAASASSGHSPWPLRKYTFCEPTELSFTRALVSSCSEMELSRVCDSLEPSPRTSTIVVCPSLSWYFAARSGCRSGSLKVNSNFSGASAL
jgi:hypothetical protein